MVRRGLAAFAAVAALAGAGHAKAPGPPAEEVKLYDGPAEALRDLLAGDPRVVAFGEYHEKTGATRVESAIARFGRQLFNEIAGASSDLIVETWVTQGNCGEKETKVVADVAETTQRPETTESEVVRLLKRAKAAGVQPHILELTCAEYKELLGGDGKVDYEKLLLVIRNGLAKKIEAVLKARGSDGNRVLVYGGALHNDVFPRRELAPFSFAREVMKAVGGRYLEVDLYVPEYIEADELLRQEKWFALWKKSEQPSKVVVIRRGPNSAMLFFARATAPPDAGAR